MKNRLVTILRRKQPREALVEMKDEGYKINTNLDVEAPIEKLAHNESLEDVKLSNKRWGNTWRSDYSAFKNTKL